MQTACWLLFGREVDVLPDDGQALARAQEQRRELAADERRPDVVLVEPERRVVLRELIGRDRGLRGRGHERVQRRRVGERAERRVERGELLDGGELRRPDGEPAVER